MPELPEVESVRRGVETYVVGKEITSVDIAHPRANRGQDEPLAGLVVGKEIAAVARRGKFMWLEFVGEDPMDSHRDVLFIHLGMSGQLRIGPTESPHRRVTVGLSDGTELHFVDQRTFGYWLYAPWSKISHIGLDPLEPGFDIASAGRRLRQKKTAVKTALLDQTLVSGIGNIYADEALWAARISPRKKASALRQKDAVALFSAAQSVMSAALKAGGTSFDSLYVNVNGESGYFARSLAAYGRAGQACSRCGTAIERCIIGGRSSHYCPPLPIGLYL